MLIYKLIKAIHAYETHLTNYMINGAEGVTGLRDMANITILAGADNPAREGLVSIVVEGVPSPDAVTKLNQEGIRTHTRIADQYSANVLTPLGLSDCIRVSLCHYNTEQEIARMLQILQTI